MIETPPRRSTSLTAQAFWLLFAKTVGFGFSLAIPLCLVRVLAQVHFGLYKQAFLIAATAQSVLQLGVGMSAFYFLPRERQRGQQVVFNILLFNLTIGTAAFLLLAMWPGLLVLIFGGAELVSYGPWIGLVILVSIFGSFLETVATAHQEIRYSTIFIIAVQLTKGLFMLAGALVFGSVRALLGAAILQGMTQSAILIWYLQSRFPGFWVAFDWRMLRTQLAYALPFGAAGIIYGLLMDMHNYFVSHRFGPAAFAVYAVGCSQLPIIGLLRESASAVAIPRVSYLQQQGARREILLLTVSAMRKLAIVFLPLYAFLVVTGREFLVVLFTAQYLDSWPIFLLNLSFLLMSILFTDHVMRAYAEQRYFLLILRIILLPVLVAGIVLGMSWKGMAGAMAAVVLSGIVERAAIAWRVVRILEVKWADLRLLTDIGKLAVISAAAALAAALVRMLCAGASPLLVLVLCALAFAGIYAGGVLSAALITPGERELLHQQWNRLKSLLGFVAEPPSRS